MFAVLSTNIFADNYLKASESAGCSIPLFGFLLQIFDHFGFL